jgi:hypothetical protein
MVTRTSFSSLEIKENGRKLHGSSKKIINSVGNISN